jgi:PAS domain S-box-containing protein
VEDLPGPRALREQIRVDETELGVLQPDEDAVWLSITAVPMGPDWAMITYGDVSAFHRTRDIQAAASRLAERSPALSLEQLLRATLDEAEALTGSCIGFFHFVEDDQETLHLQAWSTRTEAHYCRAAGKGLHYPVSKAGVWADCLRVGHSLIHNDYATLPNRQGLPEGHATLLRELVVPVHRAGRVVALLGVGNKAANYHEADVEVVQRLADLSWHLAESKRVTLALEESLATNRALIQTIPDLIFTSRRDGECLAVHASNSSFLAVPPERFLHRKIQGVLPRRLAVQMMEAFEGALDSRATKELTCSLPIEGMERHFEARVVPWTADTVITIVRDITKKKKAEDALQESERVLRESQRIAHLGSYVTDLSTGFFASSQVLDEIFGIDEHYVRSVEGWSALIHPAWQQTMKDYLVQEVLGKGLSFDKEYKIIQQNTGEERWVHGLGRLEFDAFGAPKKMIGTIRDITDHKRAEEERALLQNQLLQAQKDGKPGHPGGGIAHDMNNVLGAILGLASINIESPAPREPRLPLLRDHRQGSHPRRGNGAEPAGLCPAKPG